MSDANRVYWLHALTPLHLGRGRGEGYIDLPLMREKVTNLPFVPGSSVKGVFADLHGATVDRRSPSVAGGKDQGEVANPAYKAVLHAAFGRAGDTKGDKGANAGALVFSDARLVCLPARSLYGTFAWCTSRFVLRRLARDLEAAGVKTFDIPKATTLEDGSARLPKLPQLASVLRGGSTNSVYLEDLDLAAEDCLLTAQWADAIAGWAFGSSKGWRDEFVRRFAILPDDLFNFLCETGTEVQAHVRIEDDTKRVAEGALWYEESLPAESLLAGLVWCDRIHGFRGREGAEALLNEVRALCEGEKAVQIGGKASVGKGQTRLIFQKGPATP